MSTLCSSCGQHNRDKALRCSNCGAPLGAEPTASTAFGGLDDATPGRRVYLDDPRTDRLALRRDRRGTDRTRAAWLPWAVAALAVVLAAGAWHAYLNQSRARPAAAVAAPAGPSVPSPASSSAAALPAPTVPSASMTPATPAPVAASASAPPGNEARATPAPRPARPRAERSRPERARAPSREPRWAPEPAAADGAGGVPSAPWVTPSREAANTSAPGYSDAGPPIVPGPGPGPRRDFDPPDAAPR